MPPQQEKIKYKNGFKKWADEIAIDTRKQLGLYPSSPLCAFKLCKHLNIPIFEPSQVEGLSTEHLNELLGNGSSHWSALTIPLPLDKYLIIHNPTHSEARQQSNLMHEIAHILCKHTIPEEKRKTKLSGFLRNLDMDQENEAEWLGACLQLPRPALLYSLKKGMTQLEIAEYYNCSIEMVRYRTNITGVNKQIRYLKK